jgi:hypothetical protein
MIEIPLQLYAGTLPAFTTDPTSDHYWRELWAHEQVLNLHAMAQAEMTIQEALDLTQLVEAVNDLQYEGVVLDLGNIKVIRTRKTGVTLT